MNDNTTDTETDAASTPNDRNSETDLGSNRGTGSSPQFDRFTTEYLRGVIDRVGLVALLLLALIAGWSFYSQTGTAIRTWLDPAYQPIVLAAFNLAVLFVALAGVAHQLSRIRQTERDESTEATSDTKAPSASE